MHVLALQQVALVFRSEDAIGFSQSANSAVGARPMDELIKRLVANVGVDAATAEKAIGIVLAFLMQEGPADKVQALIDKMPGAQAAMQSAADEHGAIGGVMGACSKLMAAGLGMGQIQGVTREIIAHARDQAGEDTVGEIVGSIPGLGQFV
jgi:hypothetical protein